MDKHRTPVVIVTAHRSAVYFGYLDTPWPGSGPITLLRARNAFLWPCSMRGAHGLAVSGPGAGCRIGPAVDSETFADPVRVMTCTAEAAARWEEGTWS